MAFTKEILDLKDAGGNGQPLITYNDGTNYAFAHPLLDSTGAILDPATSELQTSANTLLAAIATATQLAATSSLQTAANILLTEILTSLAGSSSAANTSGGTSVYAAWGGTANALITNSPTQVKASAGNLYGLAGMLNPNAATVYMQFFDLAAGSVTLGTTPPKMVMPLVQGAVYDRDFTDEEKISFATAITVAVTSTATGSTAPATGVSGNIIYK